MAAGPAPAGNYIGEVGGRTLVATASFARPADTNAYTALDAIANSTSAPTVLTFASVARAAGGSGMITKVRVWTDQVGNTSQFKLHLFNVAPTAINDNAAYTELFANAATFVGEVTLAAASTDGTGSTAAKAQSLSPGLPFTCAAGDSNLYGMLSSVGGFTPASAQNFFVEIVTAAN
jgi:hypothetical protein